jgi:tRNA(Ile)-lysidine synthase
MAKSPSDIFIQHLSALLRTHFSGKPFFVVGVSGGPDSMALMYLFYKLQVNVLVVHVNYAKRGEESDKDQELVEQLAYEWGFECCSLQLKPEEAKGQNFQNWAREQRYQFFRDLKTEYDADAIGLAHHQDDQIETILQKIFRGSSPSAWQGMEIWDGELFRPLLTFSKQEILEYCEAEAIPYRIDRSNEKTDYARNLIRHDLAEKMDELLPGWKQHILALPEQGKLFETSINFIANQVLEDGSISLKTFKVLPEKLKPAVLKNIFDSTGLERSYSKGQLISISDIEHLQTGKSYQVGDYLLTRDRDVIRLHPADDNTNVKEKISRAQAKNGCKNERISLHITDQKNPEATLILDESKLSWPVTLRTWKSGDSFTPLGMNGSQKVSDHLTNRKIPTISREKALVLCGSDSTIYAIIYPLIAGNEEWGAISEGAKITPESITYLTINIL